MPVARVSFSRSAVDPGKVFSCGQTPLPNSANRTAATRAPAILPAGPAERLLVGIQAGTFVADQQPAFHPVFQAIGGAPVGAVGPGVGRRDVRQVHAHDVVPSARQQRFLVRPRKNVVRRGEKRTDVAVVAVVSPPLKSLDLHAQSYALRPFEGASLADFPGRVKPPTDFGRRILRSGTSTSDFESALRLRRVRCLRRRRPAPSGTQAVCARVHPGSRAQVHFISASSSASTT